MIKYLFVNISNVGLFCIYMFSNKLDLFEATWVLLQLYNLLML